MPEAFYGIDPGMTGAIAMYVGDARNSKFVWEGWKNADKYRQAANVYEFIQETCGALYTPHVWLLRGAGNRSPIIAIKQANTCGFIEARLPDNSIAMWEWDSTARSEAGINKTGKKLGMPFRKKEEAHAIMKIMFPGLFDGIAPDIIDACVGALAMANCRGGL